MGKYFLVAFLIPYVSLGFAQDSISNQAVQTSTAFNMITNRPGFTEASRAVYKSGFQIETALHYEQLPHFKNSENYSQLMFLPTLGLLYGVSKNVELRMFFNNQSLKTSVDKNAQYSFSGLTFGSKINVLNANGWVPEMAILVTQGVPTTSHKIDQVFSTGVLVAFGYSLTNNLGLSGNLGYAIDYGLNKEITQNQVLSHPHHLNYTCNLAYSFDNNVGVFVELSSANTLGNGVGYYQNYEGGAWYRVNPKFQIDINGGYGSELGSYFVEAGMSLLIIRTP